jgi:hypothetical protein
MIVLALIAVVFVVVLPKPQETNPEKKLIFLEQMMYQNTNAPQSTPVATSTCSKGIQKNELMAGISKVCDFNSGNVYNVSKPGPVSMKVFGWTRFFVLQDAIVGHEGAASAGVLLCSNGFEQHWGQCKNYFLQPTKLFWADWNSKVYNSTGV